LSTVPLSPADLNLLVSYVPVRHPDRFSDEVARGRGSLGGDIPFRIIGRRSEGRRNAQYERGSRRSKKEIFHGLVSFRLGLTRFKYAAKSTHLSQYRKNHAVSRSGSNLQKHYSDAHSTAFGRPTHTGPIASPPQCDKAALDPKADWPARSVGWVRKPRRSRLTNIKNRSLFCGSIFMQHKKPGVPISITPIPPPRSGPFITDCSWVSGFRSCAPSSTHAG